MIIISMVMWYVFFVFFVITCSIYRSNGSIAVGVPSAIRKWTTIQFWPLDLERNLNIFPKKQQYTSVWCDGDSFRLRWNQKKERLCEIIQMRLWFLSKTVDLKKCISMLVWMWSMMIWSVGLCFHLRSFVQPVYSAGPSENYSNFFLILNDNERDVSLSHRTYTNIRQHKTSITSDRITISNWKSCCIVAFLSIFNMSI